MTNNIVNRKYVVKTHHTWSFTSQCMLGRHLTRDHKQVY